MSKHHQNSAAFIFSLCYHARKICRCHSPSVITPPNAAKLELKIRSSLQRPQSVYLALIYYFYQKEYPYRISMNTNLLIVAEND